MTSGRRDCYSGGSNFQAQKRDQTKIVKWHCFLIFFWTYDRSCLHSHRTAESDRKRVRDAKMIGKWQQLDLNPGGPIVRVLQPTLALQPHLLALLNCAMGVLLTGFLPESEWGQMADPKLATCLDKNSQNHRLRKLSDIWAVPPWKLKMAARPMTQTAMTTAESLLPCQHIDGRIGGKRMWRLRRKCSGAEGLRPLLSPGRPSGCDRGPRQRTRPSKMFW